MSWVDRLQEATGWRRERLELDWAPLESHLGTPLPEDYKELCARFEPGMFSAFVSLLRGGDQPLYDLRSTWTLQRSVAERDPAGSARLFAPHELYGANGNRGLIQWGRAEAAECQYYWLADASTDPNQWPVVAQWAPGEDQSTFAMSTAEFVYRVIADPEFEPFSVAAEMGPPFYLPITAAPTWDPRTAG